MTTVTVVRHSDGRQMGEVEVRDTDWERYDASAHPSYQWPEGIARACDVLSEEDIERLGLAETTVIYLEA